MAYVEEENNTLQFDARQRRVKLICDCLDLAMISIKAHDYNKALNDIDDLYYVSKHLIKGKTKLKEKKKIYYSKRKRLVQLATENPQEFAGNIMDTRESELIRYYLREMYAYIMSYLEKAGFFGTTTDDEGL